jgi:hypothetical protein
MTQAELERRVLDLERKLAGGGTCGQPGLSTLYGVTSVAYRDRFPVELTSSFDATTGYDWERVFLTVASGASTVTTATGPQSGSYAFTPDNDESLTAGARGWLEADPTAAGWLFLKGAPDPDAPTAGVCGGGCGTLVGLAGDECLSFAVTTGPAAPGPWCSPGTGRSSRRSPSGGPTSPACACRRTRRSWGAGGTG